MTEAYITDALRTACKGRQDGCPARAPPRCAYPRLTLNAVKEPLTTMKATPSKTVIWWQP